MIGHQCMQPHDLRTGKTAAGSKPYRNQPKLRHKAVPLDVDMCGLMTVASIKEKPEWSRYQNGGHGLFVSRAA